MSKTAFGDIYSGGIAATKLRVGAGSATINLRGENLLGNLNAISVDTDQGVNLKMNVEADNTVKNLEFHSNTSIELSVAEGSRLLINNFTTKDNGGVWQAQNAEIIFRDWSDGSFFIGNSDYWIEDNRLYIPAVDTYVDLIAYDADGGLLSGVWSFELERGFESQRVDADRSRTRGACGNYRGYCARSVRD